MEKKLLDEGTLDSPKHVKPSFVKRLARRALRAPFIVQLLALLAPKIAFIRRQPVVFRAEEVASEIVSRAASSRFVRRAVEVVTLGRVTLFAVCLILFYISGLVYAHLALLDIYGAYLSHNIVEFVDTVSMEDPKLVSFLKHRYLALPPDPSPHPPAPVSEEGFFRASRAYPFIKNKTDGFYVEYRQHGDPEFDCFELERTQNWTGLIIEANPEKYELLLDKKRRAFLSQACLSTQPYPLATWVTVVRGHRTLNQWWYDLPASTTHPSTAAQVQCFPLFTFLLATNRKRVDFLSLDAAGSDLAVLQNIPWDRVDIRVMSVKQYFYFDQGRTKALKNHEVPTHKNVLVKYLQGKGYKSYGDQSWFAGISTTETIFVKDLTIASSDTY